MNDTQMNDIHARNEELTDSELDQVNGGIWPLLAAAAEVLVGVAAGAAAGYAIYSLVNSSDSEGNTISGALGGGNGVKQRDDGTGCTGR